MARKTGIAGEVPSRHFQGWQILAIALVVLVVVGGLVAWFSQTIWKTPTLSVPPLQGGIAPVEQPTPTLTQTPTPTATPEPTPTSLPKIEVKWKAMGLAKKIEEGIYTFYFDPGDSNTLYALESIGNFADRVWRLRFQENQGWENLGRRDYKSYSPPGGGIEWQQVSGPVIPPLPSPEGKIDLGLVDSIGRAKEWLWRLREEDGKPWVFAYTTDLEIVIAHVFLFLQPATKLSQDEREKRGISIPDPQSASFEGSPLAVYPRLFLIHRTDRGDSWVEITLSLPEPAPNPDPEVLREPRVTIPTIAVTSDGKDITIFINPWQLKDIYQAVIPIANLPN